MLNKIKEVETELNYIDASWIRELTKRIVNHIPDYFFEIPASSTGKYHPEYATGYGGLLRHVKAACKLAKDILSLESIGAKFDSELRDMILAALLLHDACKSGYPNQSKYTMHDHPLLAADLVRDSLEVMLSEAELDDDTSAYNNIKTYIDTVCELIESHMGEWNVNRYSKTILPKPRSEAAAFVHMIDYLASRKYITVVLHEQ